ncbi:MAG: hypothetical protein Fur0041_04760 [Bacteroidia bacterium]
MKKHLLTIAGALAVFALNSQIVTFNPTGTGRNGTVQQYVVPSCVTQVDIDAFGAQGGNTNGGAGARIKGTFNVTPGDILFIVVGQQGTVNTCGGAGASSGGGGGSFVWKMNGPTPVLLLAAGGGGGGNLNWSNACRDGIAAVTTQNGTQGSGALSALGGTAGNGGFGNGPSGTGSGGAGWLTAGQNSTYGTGCTGGSTYPSFTGGTGSTAFGTPGQGDGGFGGGGGAVCGNGGGGGYSGGGGGEGSSCRAGGGGGGSYNSGTNQTNTAAARLGSGIVYITPITTSSVPASPSAILGSNTMCAGDVVSFSISPVANASSYTWSVPAGSVINSGQGTTSISMTAGTTSGNVSVTASNSCGSSTPTTIAITVNALPNVTATTQNAAVCQGLSTTLNGNGAVSYSWQPGNLTGASVPVTPTVTSTYTVTGTDANGCVGTGTVAVSVNPLPVITATAAAPAVCLGQSSVLSAGGAVSYAWSTGGTNQTEVVTPTTTSSYTVTGTDANGCSDVATVTVTVNPLPALTVASTAICTGDTAILVASGANSYVWSSGSTDDTAMVAPATATTYSVTGTDANGCVDSTTVTVNVNALPLVDLGTDTAQCGGTILLDAMNQGAAYLWNDNSTAQVLTANASGTYYVAVTDNNGCTGSDTINVTIHTLPTVTGTASATTVCLDDANVTLNGSPSGGVWSGPGVSGNSFDPSVGAGAQNLTYSYTDSNGCEGSASVVINVNVCVGYAEATLSNGVLLYPNPSNGTFTLAVNASVGDMVVEVIDMQGRLVFRSNENNVQAGFTKQITLENDASGIYMVRMSTANEVQVLKVNVEK